MLNALSVFFEFAVALKLKLIVVSPLTEGAVPLITPVEEFIAKLFVDKTVPPVSE